MSEYSIQQNSYCRNNISDGSWSPVKMFSCFASDHSFFLTLSRNDEKQNILGEQFSFYVLYRESNIGGLKMYDINIKILY